MVYETRNTTSPYTAYTLANGLLISQTDSYGTLYFLTDAQNSTRSLTNEAGAVTSSYRYDAFGNLDESIAPETVETHYLYTGQQFDTETELYSLRARYYDPSIGRFTSRDTWAYNYQNPVELNRYVYAAGNPVRYTDPSGHKMLELSIKLYVKMQYSTPLRVLVGATVGAFFGGVMGAFVGALTYDDIQRGSCGSRSVAGIDRGAYIAASAIAGATFGGIIAGGVAAGGWVTAVFAGILIGSGFYGAANAVKEAWMDSWAGYGENSCAVREAVGSVMSIAEGGLLAYHTFINMPSRSQVRNTTQDVIDDSMYGDDENPPRIGMGGGSTASESTIYRDEHGRLTNGRYVLDQSAQDVHMGSQNRSVRNNPSRSQFLSQFMDEDVYNMTLQAADYADQYNLWSRASGGNLRAKVYISNGPIGIVAETGQFTSWINVYQVPGKYGTIYVHSAPTGTEGIIP